MNTNKIDLIKAEVKKLKSQLIRGTCSSQIAMETRCKEEAYNEVLAILDSLQEEPKKCMYTKDHYTDEDRKVLCDGCEEECEFNKKEPVSEDLEEASRNYTDNEEYGDVVYFAIKAAFKAGAKWQKAKYESTTEDLGDYINELYKQFPEVSFAKLSRIAVRVSRWQQNQDVKNKLPKVTNRTDLDEYAYQCAYDISNDWAIENPTWKDVENACKLGAKWKVENLWKPADGDDLPILDREVIALLDNGKVVYAHRPPEYWDGKDIVTGKVTRHYPKTYDKGGWNIPNIKYWLDCLLPNMEED